MRVENAKVEKYRTFLKDKYRPPSKGGNTGAWHLHVLQVNGESYSFLNAGSQKFVFKNDTVSFEWEWDDARTGLPLIAMPGIKLEPGRCRPASGLAGAQRRTGQMLVARWSPGQADDSRARNAA